MINKILKKYNAKSNKWFPEITNDLNIYWQDDNIKEKYNQKNFSLTEFDLLKKYNAYIPRGWYGFSFGSPIPESWLKIVDEFLEYLVYLEKEQKITNFEIHQIKLKFGGLRFYVGYNCVSEKLRKDLDKQIKVIEKCLFDKKLIY